MAEPPPAITPLPPRRRSTRDFVSGFFVVPALGLLVLVPFVNYLTGPGFLGVFVVGLIWGISQKRWSFFLGSMTCVCLAVLTLFITCLVNPPNFH